MLWWGPYLIACSTQWGWVTIFAPLWINILLRFVSGVPLLEKKYLSNPEFIHYCKETNVFFPWFKATVPAEIADLHSSVAEPLVESKVLAERNSLNDGNPDV